MSWRDLGSWWIAEVATDPAYEQVVTPLILDALKPHAGSSYLELGCGEGRTLRTLVELGAVPIGIDINEDLARLSGGRCAVAEAPTLPIRTSSVDGVYLVLALEHIVDHALVFAEAARVTRSGGVLALVCNHPIWTAPNSTPITDHDGEVLWRPGDYFSDGSSTVLAGDHDITFHHRTMASLMNAAAEAGWSLKQVIEQAHHEYDDQAGIPRLLACRWSLLP